MCQHSTIMLDQTTLFNFLQHKETVSKAENSIITEAVFRDVAPEIQNLDGTKLRLRATSNGTYNIDYLYTFKLQLEWLRIEKSIEFYKPVWFYYYYYYYDQSKLAFMTGGLFRKLVKMQDSFGNKRLVNLYFDKNLTNSAIVAGFSAENKLVLNTLFKLAQDGRDVFEYDSLHLTKRYKYILSIDGLKLKYISPNSDPMIQVYLTEEFQINVPILALLGKDRPVISPPYKAYWEKLNEYGVLSYNEKLTSS